MTLPTIPQLSSATNLPLNLEIREFVLHYNLSERETDVFMMLVNQVTSSSDIGKYLGLSPNTVSNHLKSILAKTDTNSKTELLAAFIGYVFMQLYPYKLYARRPRVLVVDDDPEICQLIKDELEMRGLIAETESNSAAVIARLQKVEYDAVVADIVMPGIDGLALLGQMREHSRKTRSIVLISGFDRYDRSRCVEQGASEFFLKPFNIDHLFFVIMENFIDNSLVRSRFLRVDTSLQVTINNEVTVNAASLGYGGMFLEFGDNIKAKSFLRQNRVCQFSIKIGETEAKLSGQVVWMRSKPLNTMLPGAGIKFVDVPFAELAKIKDFVRAHKKIEALPLRPLAIPVRA